MSGKEVANLIICYLYITDNQNIIKYHPRNLSGVSGNQATFYDNAYKLSNLVIAAALMLSAMSMYGFIAL